MKFFFGGPKAKAIRFLRAAEKGDLNAVERAIHDGMDVNTNASYKDAVEDENFSHGVTALILAAEEGHSKVVKVLLENGADVNATPMFLGEPISGSALVRAVGYEFKEENASRKEEVIKLLLAHGADVNVKDTFTGNPVLMLAASNGDTGAVKLLIEKGADPNGNGKKMTALAEAASGGHVKVVRVLLEKGVDVNATFGDGGSALRSARDQEIAKLLRDAGARKSEEAKMWWAYLHRDGTIQLKSWHQFNTYIEEARSSPEVKRFLEAPFDAATREEALSIAKRLLSPRL